MPCLYLHDTGALPLFNEEHCFVKPVCSSCWSCCRWQSTSLVALELGMVMVAHSLALLLLEHRRRRPWCYGRAQALAIAMVPPLVTLAQRPWPWRHPWEIAILVRLSAQDRACSSLRRTVTLVVFRWVDRIRKSLLSWSLRGGNRDGDG